MTISDSRRTFLKASAAATTAAVAGIPLASGTVGAQVRAPDIRWDKAACRFCGTGCSVLVGTRAIVDLVEDEGSAPGPPTTEEENRG